MIAPGSEFQKRYRCDIYDGKGFLGSVRERQGLRTYGVLFDLCANQVRKQILTGMLKKQ